MISGTARLHGPRALTSPRFPGSRVKTNILEGREILHITGFSLQAAREH